MEPETVKDAECQTIEFHYMFQTSRYEAQKEAFKEIYDIVCFYTGLPYMEILLVFFFRAHLLICYTANTVAQPISRVH